MFNQNTWSVMTGVDDGVDVYLQADVLLLDDTEILDAPMMVGFNHGEGRVIYSSFHEEGEGTSDGQKQVLKLIMFEL
jgi:hypothetical protein